MHTGLLVTVTSPFKDEEIDAAILKQHITLLLPYVSGLVLGGTTGEGNNLNDDELITLLKTAREITADKQLIAGFWRNTVADALLTAKKVAAYTDSILVPLPKELFAADDKAIEKFYLELDKNAVVPILLYNYPSRAAGRELSLKLIQNILQKSHKIVGVKDSSADLKLVKDIIQSGLKFQPLLGNDRFLFAMLNLSKQFNFPLQIASISGACSAPKIACAESKIYKLFAAGKISEAEKLQQKLNETFFEHWPTYTSRVGGAPPLLKQLLQLEVENYPGTVRSPLQHLTADEIIELQKRYTEFE